MPPEGLTEEQGMELRRRYDEAVAIAREALDALDQIGWREEDDEWVDQLYARLDALTTEGPAA